MRKCFKCRTEKPEGDFSKCSGAKYLRSECKQCSNELSRQRKELKIKYGQPPEGYVCPICSRKESLIKNAGGKNSPSWVVDHDHHTGDFRGWLCHSCNRGLGVFQDDIIFLLNAVEYLNRQKIMTENNTPQKQCKNCLLVKPFAEFSKNSRNKDGYRYFCKVCEKDKAREYYKANQGQIKDKVEQWQAKHADMVKDYKRNYYHRQKDKE